VFGPSCPLVGGLEQRAKHLVKRFVTKAAKPGSGESGASTFGAKSFAERRHQVRRHQNRISHVLEQLNVKVGQVAHQRCLGVQA
jgi:hypothetical protein